MPCDPFALTKKVDFSLRRNNNDQQPITNNTISSSNNNNNKCNPSVNSQKISSLSGAASTELDNNIKNKKTFTTITTIITGEKEVKITPDKDQNVINMDNVDENSEEAAVVVGASAAVAVRGGGFSY